MTDLKWLAEIRESLPSTALEGMLPGNEANWGTVELLLDHIDELRGFVGAVVRPTPEVRGYETAKAWVRSLRRDGQFLLSRPTPPEVK